MTPWLYLGAALALVSLGAFGGYRFEAYQVEKIELADAQASQKAVQAAVARKASEDKVSHDADVAYAKAHGKTITNTITITRTVHDHVKADADCITYGAVRVLRAAAQNNPDALSDAPGKPDAACTGLSWTQFTGDIADDYGRANQNKEQLKFLEEWVEGQEAVSVTPTGHTPSQPLSPGPVSP